MQTRHDLGMAPNSWTSKKWINNQDPKFEGPTMNQILSFQADDPLS